MKKILAIILTISLVLCMAACDVETIEQPSDNQIGDGQVENGGGQVPSGDGQTGGTSSTPNTPSSGGGQSGGSTTPSTPSTPSGGGGQSGGSTTPSTPGTTTTTPANLGPKVLGTFYRDVVRNLSKSTDATVLSVDAKADAMLKKIEDYPDNISVKGTTYYVSALGNDSNSGTSPEKAVKTYASIRGRLKSGDAVLFRRGDIFRGAMKLVSGVSFGAYGQGIKPRFYGSVDAAKSGGGKWTETSTKNVYVFNKVINEYSNIVFNNGEAIGRPVQKMEDITKRALNVVYKSGRVYLYSPNGNPQDLYSSIEIAEGYILISGDGVNDNILIQNFCIMYAGLHGIGGVDNTKNFEVEGCVVGYIGGKGLYLGGTSIGNGMEFWADCDNLQVHDNYVFQCFDAGITHQSNTTVKQSVFEDNVHYTNNLVEYCIYSFEAFTASTHGDNKEYTDRMGDVYIENNICRYAGWGWGYLDRPDKGSPCDIKYRSCDHVEPLKISGNIFDRPKQGVAIMTATAKQEMLIFTNNTIIQNNKRVFMTLTGVGECRINDDLNAFMSKAFKEYSGNKFTLLK